MIILPRVSRFCVTTALIGALTLPLGACQTTQERGSGETIGAITGAILGGIAGSKVGSGRGNTAAIIFGALAGAAIGSELGKQLDEKDRLAMGETTHTALEKGKPGEKVEWRNPDSGHSGTVTPQEVYKTSDNKTCREFQQTVFVDGAEETAYRTACRQPDGSWKIVSS